ncbi:cupin [Nocardia sp. CDC160]|uniref:cupin n=1 Tax=Nocardia sp. CDC160 TaxID=3112166 RepID=UPI002DBB3E9B|nr:cupin [Nocardia sp. CDC160]MEC3920305.1 cupin [Nocardia sp. CDC160]
MKSIRAARNSSRYGLRAVITGLAAIGLTAVIASPASATPAEGVTGTVLGQISIGGTDYILREITIAPGGSTGWHYHDGPVYGTVRSGVLSHYHSDCTPDGVYHAGESLAEAPSASYIHIGRNLGSEPLVLDVLYVLPSHSPLSEDVPAPTCA